MTDQTTEALAEGIARSRDTDHLHMESLLADDEMELLAKVRKFGDKELLPIVNDYWERGEFPFEILPKLRELKVVGDTMTGYGTTPMSAVGQGLVSYELGRIDGSIATFMGVHVGLAMQSIYILGSEEQRQRWLPDMANLDRIGAFALTEPDHGSDSVALEATATRDGSDWILNGLKRWPGNATWCDIVVEMDDLGYSATKIGGKVSLRMVQNADIVLDEAWSRRHAY